MQLPLPAHLHNPPTHPHPQHDPIQQEAENAGKKALKKRREEDDESLDDEDLPGM